MKVIELDMYQATALAAIVLLLGRVLVSKIEILRRYCIPAPVVGGFVYAILHTIVRGMGILEISADMTLKNVFMVAFFCSVGFTASFRMLKKGGIQTMIFLGLAVVMVVLQNVLGASLATVFDLDPRLGLATASIPMVGGHGTAGSFGPQLEMMGVARASVVAIASATYGLVAGCVIGGPIATAKIRKFKLTSVGKLENNTEVVEKDETGAIDSARILDGLLYIYANFVVFNVLGRSYDAAVMTSGFCGFGMGATPNAMANMQAITSQYGPAPTAFMVVPLVGSLFIDFLNASILTGFISVLG